jgi:hypothetical protein
MPMYFLLQVLQVKYAARSLEYCINCVYFTQNRNNNFLFLQHKKTGSKRSGGTPIERYKNSDTTTVSGRDKLKVVVLLSRVERDKTLGDMSIPNF